MTLLGALHVHSDFSHDGRDTLEGVRAWAERAGIGFVGMTEHAEDLDAATWQRYRERCGDLSDGRVRIIPGLEFRFSGFPGVHLLAFDLERWMEPTTPGEFFNLAAGNARFTCAAHPVAYDYALPDEVAARVDAIEVWNTQYNTRYLPDPRAIDLLQRLRRARPEVVGFAGLDQHNAANDRGARVVLTAPDPDPLGTIRAGRFRNRGRLLGFGPDVGWGPIRLGLLRAARAGLDSVSAWQDRRAMERRRAAHHPKGA